MTISPLPYRRVANIEPLPPGTSWLVENLWLQGGVGLLGGQAKVCKTYLAGFDKKEFVARPKK